jgi:nicotinamidase-related amidase
VLTGVSTDCCVLSTALAAADAGCFVQVVADACAGVTDTDHDRALAAMALYEPLIRVTTVAEILDEPADR